jgi:hypothetical protein
MSIKVNTPSLLTYLKSKMWLALISMMIATVVTPIPTTLPTAPMENARVIVAPCSPLMAAQQQWTWPETVAAPLTLRATQMSLHLLPPPSTATDPAGVVRASTDAAAMWLYNSTLSVLQLVGGQTKSSKCLAANNHGMSSNVATATVPSSNVCLQQHE